MNANTCLVTCLETTKKAPEVLELLVAALLAAIDDSSLLISLRLLLPQYKRLIKTYSNHLDPRISFVHLAACATANGGDTTATGGNGGGNGGHRRKKSAQSLVQRSLRVPFFGVCGDPNANSPTVLYKAEQLGNAVVVARHVDLTGPTYGAVDLLPTHNHGGGELYKHLGPRRLAASSPNLLSFQLQHSNNSGLTLHKVTAIQSAIDDNKSPTFGTASDAAALASVVSAASFTSSHDMSASAHHRQPGLLQRFDPANVNVSLTAPHTPASPQSLITWGWLLLISTWVIVILGIGAMLDLWVYLFPGLAGLPYALHLTDYGSPEGVPLPVHGGASYEKETGVPVPGYYWCLVFMTGVAAWVWCVVSWMGMKFFRHTKGGLTREKTLNN